MSSNVHRTGRHGKSATRPPKVAVVTRTRDRPLLLERALDSVSRQSMKDLSWVVVNDGGHPGAVDDIVRRAVERGIHAAALHHAGSKGMEAASNAGIRHTESVYVAIHDDDDTWEPDFLKVTTEFLDSEPHYVGVVTHVTTIRERIRRNGIDALRHLPHQPLLKAVHLADMARSNLFPPIGLLYRRSLFRKLRGYDETLEVLGDWDFNLRALMVGDIGVIPLPLANYHVRDGTEEAGAAYANTVSAQLGKHHATDAIYRNRQLRADLKAGRFGLGFLLMVGRLGSRAGAAKTAGPLNAWLGKLGKRKSDPV